MSATREIWNLSALCRCCHIDGKYKSLDSPYFNDTGIEVYSDMIRDTFDIVITRPLLDASYTICDDCIAKLRDAAQFKKQVAICEEKFQEYCKNEMVTCGDSVKIEVEVDTGEMDYSSDIEYNVDITENDVKSEETTDYTDDAHTRRPLSMTKKFSNIVDSLNTHAIPFVSAKQDAAEVNLGTEMQSEDGQTNIEEETKLVVKITPDEIKEKPKVKKKGRKEGHTNIEEETKLDVAITPDEIKEKPEVKKKTIRRKRTTPRDVKPKYDFSLEVLVKTDSGIIYSCKTCGGSYNDRKLIKKHITTNHLLGERHTCDICQKIFQSKIEVTNHRLTHEKNPECHYCFKTFSTARLLRPHIINTHLKLNKQKCDLCSKEFCTKSSLKKHLLLHSGESRIKKLYICYKCGHGFNDTTNMNKHIMTVHEKQRPFICDLCQKSFTAKKHLLVHINRHMGYKPFRCDSCNKTFDTYNQRKMHRCVTAKEKQDYKCIVCLKIFKEKRLFLRHIKRMHNGERPYPCQFCSKDFTCKYSMKRHELSHSGIKPFSCIHCDKKFTAKALVKRHILSVHKPKDIQCGICNEFISDLRLHNSYRHNVNRVNCDECEKSFSHKTALNRHKKNVHIGLKYKCVYCNKMYGQKNKLVKHQLKVHGIEVKDVDLVLPPFVIENKNEDVS